MNILDSLNPQQREAVLATDGPILILAGAGTGKTRVITHRIAYLIQQGVPGGSILAVTFTNKAADEMRERVRTLLENSDAATSDPWISTFHSFCVRLLRREAPRLGLPRNFTIYDDDEQLAALKLALADLGRTIPAIHRGRFSRASASQKITCISSGKGARGGIGRARQACGASLRGLRKNPAQNGSAGFRRSASSRGGSAARVSRRRGAPGSSASAYVHVDEYQDTNRVQYDLLRLLVGERPNLCVVGDEDQSIYRWRGADVGNILQLLRRTFRRARFPHRAELSLDGKKFWTRPRRWSPRTPRRIGKVLSATRGEGSNLVFYEARDARGRSRVRLPIASASCSARTPSTHLRGDVSHQRAVAGRWKRRFARAAFATGCWAASASISARKSRTLSPTCAWPFFQRTTLRYLRVLNTPPRGIGKVTVEALLHSLANGIPPFGALSEDTITSGTARAVAPLRSFRDLIEQLREKMPIAAAGRFIAFVLEATGYLGHAAPARHRGRPRAHREPAMN